MVDIPYNLTNEPSSFNHYRDINKKIKIQILNLCCDKKKGT